jgi:hypothetical protein
MSFSDESIHLIATCQLAGFRHGIGTLWEVDDRICVDIARITYQSIKDGIKDGYMTDESVCRGLHFAIKGFRDLLMREDEDPGVISPGSNANAGNPQGGRDGHISDKEDDEIHEKWSNWVPYVHFGV